MKVNVESTDRARQEMKDAVCRLLSPYYGSGPTSGRFRALWLSPEQVADLIFAPIEPTPLLGDNEAVSACCPMCGEPLPEGPAGWGPCRIEGCAGSWETNPHEGREG